MKGTSVKILVSSYTKRLGISEVPYAKHDYKALMLADLPCHSTTHVLPQSRTRNQIRIFLFFKRKQLIKEMKY